MSFVKTKKKFLFFFVRPLNPLGNRQEIQQTIVWIKTHLEEDSEISIPKQDVYDQYL